MRFELNLAPARAGLAALCLVLLGGCAIAKPRTDDPWQSFNRKMYAFNDAADKAVIRPVAAGYRKITTPNVRRVIDNFFANIKMPITILNDILQGDPRWAVRNTGRFVVNTTLGFAGFFDPASEMNLQAQETDFGVTLARWGVPEGPYLVLPFVGPTTVRDVWRLPVDNYFDPLGWFAREHSYDLYAEYMPQLLYLVTLRSAGIEAENMGMLRGIYDPYTFYRDAYRQRRLYLIYRGNPPESLIEQMEGTNELDVEQLLEEQRSYEQTQPKPGGKPPPKDHDRH